MLKSGNHIINFSIQKNSTKYIENFSISVLLKKIIPTYQYWIQYWYFQYIGILNSPSVCGCFLEQPIALYIM